jgi:integrase/recombinase XerD
MEGLNLTGYTLIDSFLNDCINRGMTMGSTNSYKYSIINFLKYIENKDIDLLKVNRQILVNYINFLRSDRNYNQKTIENHFTSLSTFYDYLVFEDKIQKNIINEIRKRYLRRYKNTYSLGERRKLINVEEMSDFINSIMDIRDKAIAILLAKTGIRRGELVNIELDDIKWDDYHIILKPTPKRSNRTVFFDRECASVLQKWIIIRNELSNSGNKALYISKIGEPLERSGVYNSIRKWADKYGLHDSNSKKLEDRFSVHCFRHWFTTWLLRNGMPRDYVKELRGDSRKDAIDIYNHIDYEDLRKQYLACIPKLGVF